MRFLTFAWKNLIHRPARSLLTVVGLSVSVAAVVSLVGISSGFESSFLDLYNSRGIDLIVQRFGGRERLNNVLDEKFAEPLRRLPGVRDVAGGLMDTISIPEANLFAVIVNGLKPGSFFFKELTITSGRTLEEGDTTQALLGKVLAANTGKKVGDTIHIYDDDFTVVGICESLSVYENGMIVMSLAEMQRQMDRPHRVTAFTVKAEKTGDRSAVAELRKRIKEIDPSLDAQPTEEYIRGVNQIQISRAVAWITSAIALAIGAIGMLNTIVMSVFERMHEIGMLRAIGWHKGRVVRMILTESLLLSLGGAVLGVVGALAMTHFLSTLPQTAGLIQGGVAPAVILQGFVIALLVGVGAAAYPAWWSANLMPIDAMRRK